jgi:hypothetical protein
MDCCVLSSFFQSLFVFALFLSLFLQLTLHSSHTEYPTYRKHTEEDVSLEGRLDREQRRQRQLESELTSLKLYWQPTYVDVDGISLF